jgi:hypothetical protein
MFMYTQHARDVMAEREIPQAWVERVLEIPLETEPHEDGTRHYLAPVPEWGNRTLRVVVNEAVEPPRVVTVFFDRRRRMA